MFTKFSSIIVAILVAMFLSNNVLAERGIRQLNISGPVGEERSEFGILEDDTLKYDDERNLTNIYDFPNQYGDDYPTVRFTPGFAPFKILEVHIAFFHLPSMGTPNAQINFWQSGEYRGQPGYPVDPIDSLVFQFEEMVFTDTTRNRGVVFNYFDVSDLNIIFGAAVDFHIGYKMRPSDENDSLSLIMDTGSGGNEDSRSYMLLEEDDSYIWYNMLDIDGISRPYNFAIRCVIANLNEDTTSVRELTLLYPSNMNLNAVYPNPFNSSATISVSLQKMDDVKLNVYDLNGNLVQSIFNNRLMPGDHQFTWHALNQANGIYFIKLEGSDGVKIAKSTLLK